ncbi:MAG: glycosyltransferase family 4 protein [Candidatus Hydrogenedentes bacterium]|nr:glycosyltransferase family 4 protein [Candidatus Hydrogenedentota bacterium]
MRDKKLRVLFLTLYPERAASSRYRVAQFLPYLRASGVDCTVMAALTDAEYERFTGSGRKVRPFWYHAAETPRRLCQLAGTGDYDVVVLQKACLSAYVPGIGRVLRNRARRLVYDIDDAVHLAPPHPLRGIWRLIEDRGQVRSIMAMSDRVLAGNAWLRDEANAAGGRATLFPTVVDTDRFVPAAERPDSFCFGWIGGPSTTPHLDAARTLGEFKGATLRLVGADAARSPWPQAEVRAWSLDREVEEIQQFSVGIMPLPKDTWTRGKCALKALQYMACGVPCIATPYGAILDIIEDGANGLFADTPDQWMAAAERLRDPVLRKRIGDAGRATVESRFALRDAAPCLRTILEEVA